MYVGVCVCVCVCVCVYVCVCVWVCVYMCGECQTYASVYRNDSIHLCFVQAWTKLNHLNVTLSYNAILRRVDDISKQHTKMMDKWLSEGAFVKFVGDNVDKQFSVRDIRSDHHAQLRHMFSLLVIKARIPPPPSLLPELSTQSLTSVKVDSFLPSLADMKVVQCDVEVLFGRIICDYYIKDMSQLKKFVASHIPHIYSDKMADKSEVVVLDVLHKNEMKSTDMIHIMRVMASYLGTTYKHVVYTGGDHVTCEREQGAKRHVMCSNTPEGRLEQLEPCVEDWHCVMNFMMVTQNNDKYVYK